MNFYTDNEGFFYYSKDGVEKIYPMKKMEAWIMENLRTAELNGEKSDFNKEYKNYIKGGNFDSPEIYKKVEETLKSLGNGNLNKGICVITVPQRDSNGNIKKDSHGNPLTTTLNCSEGTYGALSKLSSKVVDLTYENKQLRNQLNQQNNISRKDDGYDR